VSPEFTISSLLISNGSGGVSHSRFGYVRVFGNAVHIHFTV
jgi:hypothetical protein